MDNIKEKHLQKILTLTDKEIEEFIFWFQAKYPAADPALQPHRPA